MSARKKLNRAPSARGGKSLGFQLHLETLEDRLAPALLGQQLFPDDNPWNQQITSAPVAANSTAIINNIVSRYGNGALHPDFSQDFRDGRDLYGIPFNIVHGNSTPKIQVVINDYADESDLIPAPMLSNFVLEGDFQNGPRVGVDNRGDSHLLVWDVDNNVAYEFYRASRPSENADGKWHADQQSVWDMKTNTFRTVGWTSADAAGLSLLVGLVRPDEALPVSQGGQGKIDHAIRFTLQNSIILDQFLYPASHVANSGHNPAIQPPMGARFRLKSTVDISQLNPQSRIIAQAMKDYGMIVADNGSNFYFSGASSSVDAANNRTLTFNDNDIQDSVRGLKSLRFSDFEVVDLTPVVTSLSASSGQAGNSVTIVGQNFSGAAGQLQVFFGATRATSVTIVDDAHLQVIVPAGTGTVDVRVQSGVSTAPDSQNIKSTIYGYGISAVTTADRFTFGGTTPPNTAPIIVTASSASPNPVNGTTTTLSALGGDDGGEANLTYTWSSTGPAAVTYSANGTNAAKSSSATFTASGSYTFVVTIRDAGGLVVTSSAVVSVTIPPPANKAPTVATPAAASPSPVNGTTTTLSVLGADDAGESNLTYTWSSTGPAAVTFSANGTNAAKSTTATFTASGSYTFVATIRDAGGQVVTSSAVVSVTIPPPANKAPTVATPAAASPSPVNGTTTTLSVLGADDAGESKLTYTWSSTGPAAVTFSANGTNAAKSTTATFTASGSYTMRVTVKDAAGLTVTSSVVVSVTIPTVNKAPTVKTPAAASPSPVIGKTTQLTALGADDGGEAKLTYTWAVVSKPSGAADPTFSVNGTNAAKSATATFTRAGVYTFRVTIRDVQGLTVTSSVSVTVVQSLTSIVVTPTSAVVAAGAKMQFTGQALDQFGIALATQPKFSWSLIGNGSVSSSGLYTAPTRTGGPYTIFASAGGVTGKAKVTVVAPGSLWLRLASSLGF